MNKIDMSKIDISIFKPFAYFALVIVLLTLFNDRLAILAIPVLRTVALANRSVQALNGISMTFLIVFLFWFGHRRIFSDASQHLHHNHKTESELAKERKTKVSHTSRTQWIIEKLIKWFGAGCCVASISLAIAPILQARAFDLHSLFGILVALVLSWIGKYQAEQYFEGLKSQLSFNPHESIERGLEAAWQHQGNVVEGRVDAVFPTFFTVTGTDKATGKTFTVVVPMTANRFRVEVDPGKPRKGNKSKSSNSRTSNHPVLRGHGHEEQLELEDNELVEDELGLKEPDLSPTPLIPVSAIAEVENAIEKRCEARKCTLGKDCPNGGESAPALYCSLIDRVRERTSAGDEGDEKQSSQPRKRKSE